jgi:ketosteroid isomerase-like protein
MTTPAATAEGIPSLAEATAATLATIHRFNDALNRHDVDAVMALMTDDCVFENTWPAPDGERHEGQAAVRSFWERLIAESPRAHFELEDLFAAGDRATQRWRYTWGDAGGVSGHIRGVDVFRVRDGKVAEKLAYVKG